MPGKRHHSNLSINRVEVCDHEEFITPINQRYFTCPPNTKD
jgi:hypothetical protein